MTAGTADTLLDPKDAVSQYVKGGLTTAVGMPNVYQLRALFAASIAERFAWARAVALEFTAQFSPAALTDGATPNSYALGDVGTAPDAPITSEAFAYLAEVCQGYPYIGRWVFVRDASSPNASPDIAPLGPQIIATDPPAIVDGTLTAAPAVVKIETHEGIFAVVGDDLHKAVMAAVALIERGVEAIVAEAKKL